MPLLRFELRNEYGLGDPELHKSPAKREDPKALLDGVAVAGLVGILRQLGDLAEFAADVFHDLHEQVTATAARGRKMLTRIQHIEAALPSIEKAVQNQTSHIHFAYIAGTEWHASVHKDDSPVLSNDLPQFMMDLYEECRDPPRLHLLDRFDFAGPGACLKRYSDPSYFKRVWSASEQRKAEKLPREKKIQKYKRKGSRLINGGVQTSITRSHQNRRSTRYPSPSTDSLSISSEDTFIPSTRIRHDAASASTSFGSKKRISVDQASDTNPSIVPDELECESSSFSKFQVNHTDASIPKTPDNLNRINGSDFSQNELPQDLSASESPNLTWDEKIEIVKPMSPKSCDDIPVDTVQETARPEVIYEPLIQDPEDAYPQVLEQEDVTLNISNVPVLSTIGNHFEELTSETDNYTDARNTMESESETDYELQTKREVNFLGKFSNQGLESLAVEEKGQTPSIHGSDFETSITSNDASNNDVLPELPNLDHVQTPLANGFATALDGALGSDLYEDAPNLNCALGSHISESNFYFAPKVDHACRSGRSESSIHDIMRTNQNEDRSDGVLSQVIEMDDKTPEASTFVLDSPGRAHVMPSIVLEMGDSLSFQIEMGVKTLANSSDVGDLPAKTHDTTSAAFWTNGGLLGLEPSKPPVFNSPDAATETIVSGGPTGYTDSVTCSSGSKSSLSAEKVGELASVSSCINNDNALRSNHLNDRPHSTVQPTDLFKVADNSHISQQPSPLILYCASKDTASASSYSHNESNAKESKDDAQVIGSCDNYDLKPQSYQSSQNALGISSTLSSIAQRLLANGLQGKVSLLDQDISKHSEMSSLYNGKLHETDRAVNYQEVFGEVPCQRLPESNGPDKRGSFKRPISSTSVLSGQSSPPLEHMKISFHPMNGSETSKLKLDFSRSDLYEGSEDLAFPSFQLLPQTAVSLPDSGLDSDDDTFCRSCPYSSEDDLLSLRSDSDSDIWEHDETSTSRNHSTHKDLLASISYIRDFEECNGCRLDPATGIENPGLHNDTALLQSGPDADLPTFDSIKCFSSQQARGDSLLTSDVDSTFQSPSELPPPPPLPPVQWRRMKTFPSGVVRKKSVVAERIDQFNGLEEQRVFGYKQSGHIPKPPPFTRVTALPTKQTHQLHKLIEGEVSQSAISKEPDKREDLLQQIRNKAFNLKRTATTKSHYLPEHPSNNVEVAAILVKANAIRQAFAGSDDGGEDDNWSDT